jgi:Raf kinase inhibitor-like YbhB/YbcL family protein
VKSLWRKPDLVLALAISACIVLLVCCGSETTTTIRKLEKPPMTLSSPAFAYGGTLPDRYAGPARGDEHPPSPPLEWSDVPDGTRCFALVFYEPDVCAAGRYGVRWLALNLPGDTRYLAEGAGSRGADAGEGTGGYIGAGRSGSKPRRFVFTLYALDSAVDKVLLPAGPAELEEAVAGHILAKAELACYTRRAPLSLPSLK